MTQINDIKKELKQLFHDKGWMYESEGQTPPYYNIYSAVVEFIEEKFYKGRKINDKQVEVNNMEYSKTGYSICSKCNRKRVYYRVTTKDFRCRNCGIEFKDGTAIKTEQKIKSGEIKCSHYKGEGYHYNISDKETLLLCDQCNLNLAGEVMKQMATEVFARTMINHKK